MLRLFVALEIPYTLRQELAALQSGVPGARWVDPDNFHITLRFIGEIDQGQARDLDEMLLGLRAPAFTLQIAGVGHFGDDKPRVLYATMAPNPALDHLRRKVDSAVARAGVKLEGGKYRPHVTLARFSGRDLAGHHLAQFLASHGLLRSEPFAVERFCLFSSLIRPDGPIYTVEADYALTALR
ncbi:MAG: RNA 2',3'-cyclic phosphodiesterase [Rhodospirillales bacterium]